MKFAKKSLGQNFLIDKNIIKKITNLVDIKNKNVIEIGPGKGALTNEIIKMSPKSLVLVEKDHDLCESLKENFYSNKRIKILNSDILETNLKNIIKDKTIIFGNLPYNISSQILVKTIKNTIDDFKCSDVIFMFQKELGEKIIGKFKTKNYGRLSIITSYKYKVENKFLVSPSCFFPMPKVTSIVIHFKPKKKSLFKIKKIESLEKITHFFFSSKRKMINKKVKSILNENEIKSIKDLKLNLRPSEIKPDVYYKISEYFERK